MKTRIAVYAVITVIFAICLAVGMLPSKRASVLTPVYASPETVTARRAMIGGREVGEVLIDNQVVFRIRTSAGGLSPYQRAQVVAQRLQTMLGDTLQPEDITTGRVNGQDVVLAKGEVIVTADDEHARLNDTSTFVLANLWASQLEAAVSGQPVNQTRVSQKVVPIISVAGGVRVGGALVTGDADRVDDVNAVAQVEGTFGRSVRGRVLIPVSSQNVVQEVRRVPETSVIGLVDIRL